MRKSRCRHKQRLRNPGQKKEFVDQTVKEEEIHEAYRKRRKKTPKIPDNNSDERGKVGEAAVAD